MQTIILIRHGESEWNLEGRVQGYLDSPLSNLGVEQAHRIGERLKRESIDHVVSSTASRAIDTCRIALGSHMHVETSDALREINLGIWEGRRSTDLKLEYPREVEMWYRMPSRVKIDRGESLRAFRLRVTRELDRIRAEQADKTFAVFTHGGVICTYLTSLLGMKLDDLWRFKIRNGSITTIIFPKEQPRIALLGDTHHLDGCERIDSQAATRFFP
ncbi:MAG: histidine phosphatase family protein [Candidatus Latescibacteria bacterium]|nr:histidine phosphatase family protein [Candidatus Latescibacterota bacterium]NIM21987.1 histidine phosphatase family protein [Candidatus Latescibacterota bacterium]NIM66005.1 histidine phosphatase family protein [Candidatus Latescibacterota bacterium]NIO02413.1 histidine phosphatase family protein [Candidatus Latescibacterota bacterium]NIO29324.1 histidine phosphatase family protein [Candidatus Latescibacterota bacterium]